MQFSSLAALFLLGVAVYAADEATTTAKIGEVESTTVAVSGEGKTRCTRHHKDGEHKQQKGEHKPSIVSVFQKLVNDAIFESRIIDILVAKFERGAKKHHEFLTKLHEKKEEDKKEKIAAPQGFKKHGEKKDEDRKTRPAHVDKKHDEKKPEELVKNAVETTVAPAAVPAVGETAASVAEPAAATATA